MDIRLLKEGVQLVTTIGMAEFGWHLTEMGRVDIVKCVFFFCMVNGKTDH